MGELLPMPRVGDVFSDVRSADRTMRVSWHAEAGDAGQMVVSLWSGRECRASFRLAATDVPRLIETLTQALPNGDNGAHADHGHHGDAEQPDAPISPAA
jgi:hypothetical protein